jgi:SAM-dependent methyltransferase
MFPIRLGSEAEFAALRNALRASDFAEASPLFELLVEGNPVPADSPIPLRELTALGLVVQTNDTIEATALLYPLRGLYIVSDLQNTPPLDDTVYPANIPTTEQFLDHIPTTPCDACLDLGSGTGVAALLAARDYARHAWAFDITARSTHFAEFNRRLNAIPNFTAAKSDLYEVAGDLTFDRIVTHPPYLPVYRPRYVFDSGGQDGEQIVKRIVEGLPKYLRPGGSFHALMMGSDRDRPFEYRLREWLGEASAGFDVAFIVRKTFSPRDYASDAVIKHKGSVEDISGWRELFQQWRVRKLAYGTVVIQRRKVEREVFTVRRVAGAKTGPAECAKLVDWSTQALDIVSLLQVKPRGRENVSLQSDHRLIDGEWQPKSYRLETDYPFEATMVAEPWAPNLLTAADGQHTIAELLDQLKATDSIADSVTPNEFAKAVASMIAAGFLEV